MEFAGSCPKRVSMQVVRFGGGAQLFQADAAKVGRRTAHEAAQKGDLCEAAAAALSN